MLDPAQKRARRDTTVDEAPAASRRPTIFLVEDEPQIRHLIVRVLERAGFAVQSTDDPEQALSLIVERSSSIDLLLTDVQMPKMTGPRLVREIRKHFPDLPVLFMSGYVGESEDDELSVRGAPLLRKPFVPSKLLAIVHEVLDGR